MKLIIKSTFQSLVSNIHYQESSSCNSCMRKNPSICSYYWNEILEPTLEIWVHQILFWWLILDVLAILLQVMHGSEKDWQFLSRFSLNCHHPFKWKGSSRKSGEIFLPREPWTKNCLSIILFNSDMFYWHTLGRQSPVAGLLIKSDTKNMFKIVCRWE